MSSRTAAVYPGVDYTSALGDGWDPGAQAEPGIWKGSAGVKAQLMSLGFPDRDLSMRSKANPQVAPGEPESLRNKRTFPSSEMVTRQGCSGSATLYTSYTAQMGSGGWKGAVTHERLRHPSLERLRDPRVELKLA